jgi:hypothetical protein
MKNFCHRRGRLHGFSKGWATVTTSYRKSHIITLSAKVMHSGTRPSICVVHVPETVFLTSQSSGLLVVAAYNCWCKVGATATVPNTRHGSRPSNVRAAKTQLGFSMYLPLLPRQHHPEMRREADDQVCPSRRAATMSLPITSH